mgnify:FL=1
MKWNIKNYTEIYDHDYYLTCDGIGSWINNCLKFGDAFAAVCYAHGIRWKDMRNSFPLVSDQFATMENHPYTAQDQKKYILDNLKITPKNILDIGGGRGELPVFLGSMGYNIVSVDPQKSMDYWYRETSKRFFGLDEVPVKMINKPIEDAVQDISFEELDTILLVESLEHIPEKLFDLVYEKIKDQFKGRFIVANWVHYHPIFFKRFQEEWEHPHCRHVDDGLYDKWSSDASVAFRYGSHLVLEYT